MNMHRKRHPGSMLLIILVLGALLGACGAEQPTGETVNTKTGVITVGTPTAGLNTCTSCHPGQTADWMLSKHANVEPLGNLFSAGNPTLGQISSCTTMCHDPLGDSGLLVAGYTGATDTFGNLIKRPVIGCESCHGGGSLHVAQGGAGPIGYAIYTAGVISGTTSSVQVSAQFATCTSCHQLLDPNDPVSSATLTPVHSAASGTNPTGTDYTITDTHFATPGDFTGAFDGGSGQNKHNITGYAMDYASETVCSDCHNPHKNADINREWAKSAHADTYSNYHLDSSTQDIFGYFSAAWAHYNWSDASRLACQRCHTTTGFRQYADALRSGNTQRALDIQHGLVTLVTSTSRFKPEMLKCNGCHTDNKGTVRNPGAITANYDYISSGYTYALVSTVYPDVKNSNVCMACHTARESGDTIRGLNDSTLRTRGSISFFDFSAMAFINSHYLSAGGTVFTATGFEFDGRSYDNLDTYRHRDIGTPSAPQTGSNGPCIGCHMSRPANSGNHLFLPVTRSTTTPGWIDSVASQACIYCHTTSGAGGLEELLNERKAEYRESIEAAIYVLDNRGIYFRPASPYFYERRAKGTTATVINGNDNVTVASTAGVNGAETSSAADYFKVDSDGTYYRIRTVVDATTLQLDENYEGPGGGPLDYTIITSTSSSLRTGSTVSAVTAMVTQGSVTVVVTGATYSIGPVTICPKTCSSSKPDIFKVAGIENQYQIAKVSDDTVNTSTIRLVSAYLGANAGPVNFSILKAGDSGLRDWRTKAGSGIVAALAADTDTSGKTTGRYNMGAAFNLNLIEHEPGGYVHNRVYIKRLIYDAIDWADDNLMNFSVGKTLSTSLIDGGAPVWKAGAMQFLLPNGVLGIAAERP